MRGFTAEWNKEQGARSAQQDSKRDELGRLNRKIDNLVDAVGENRLSSALQAALPKAEARKVELEADLALAEAPVPRLMPNLANLYRAKIEGLRDDLNREDAGAVRERIRALIEEIRLVPCPIDPTTPLTIEVRGDLAAMLALGTGSPSTGALLEQQIKMVAGAGFEPAAFRL